MKKLSLLFTALVLLVTVNNKTAIATEWHRGIYVAPKLNYNYVVMTSTNALVYLYVQNWNTVIWAELTEV